MSDTVQPNAAHSREALTAREDIAFMRAMAEEGARRPILGGSILLATGLIWATACFGDWLVMTNLPPRVAVVWMNWIGGSGLAAQFLGIAVLVASLRRGRGGTLNRANRVFAQAWNAVGFAIMACLASFFLSAWLAHKPDVFLGFPAVILTLYGVGWTVTASASDVRWTWGVAMLSFLFAIATGAVAGNVNLPLLFAVAIILLLAVPGAILIRQARP
jgi:hypothetical protein